MKKKSRRKTKKNTKRIIYSLVAREKGQGTSITPLRIEGTKSMKLRGESVKIIRLRTL
jgi:hypothetical protein